MLTTRKVVLRQVLRQASFSEAILRTFTAGIPVAHFYGRAQRPS